MKWPSFTFILSLFGFLMLTACEGPEGPEGPAGPAGPAGNANVKSTTVRNLSLTLNPLVPLYTTNVPVPDITADIMARGSVAVYISQANNTSNAYWAAIPGNFQPPGSTTVSLQFFDYQISAGSVTIFTRTSPGYNIDARVVVTAGQ